ncbi:MAG: hypothetical protein ACK55I_29815, partial [bacterium]
LLERVFKRRDQTGGGAIRILPRGVEGVVVLVVEINVAEQRGEIIVLAQTHLDLQPAEEDIGIVERLADVTTIRARRSRGNLVDQRVAIDADEFAVVEVAVMRRQEQVDARYAAAGQRA